MRTLLIFVFLGAALAAGCESKEREAAKREASRSRHQMSSCTNDVKRVLNDPSSLEVLSSRTVQQEETTLIILDFTARNSFGGRVRKSTTCVFKKGSTSLDYDAFQNELRRMGTFN